MSRDDQFMGFAKLLMQELPDCPMDDSLTGIALADWRKECEQIIARRAYDLVYHTLSHTTQGMAADCEIRSQIAETVTLIPDMTTWPEETNK